MKRIAMILCMCLILVGCSEPKKIQYTQRNLQKPDRILVRCTEIDKKDVYEPDSEVYENIFTAINQNWWKYSSDGAFHVSDGELVEAKSLNDLKTTSDKRYETSDMVFMDFEFLENPMTWIDSNGAEMKAGIIRFALPKDAEQDKHTKYFFQVMAIDENKNQSVEGIYTYYYNDDLFHALSSSGQKVISEYPDSKTDIDVSSFSDITSEEMKDAFITNRGWTGLESHQVFWNSTTKQVLINLTFSNKTAEDQLESARDYRETISLYRNYPRPDSETAALWRGIPNDAEVIIQVYREAELISQDIYGNIEGGLIYKEIHYENK